MANSVSNDALWEKLSEISQQLNSLSIKQKSQVSSSDQIGNTSDSISIKNEIINEIKEHAKLLGMHSDVNFKANEQNVKMIDENIRKIFNIVARIRKQQRETSELQAENGSGHRSGLLETQVKDNREYFNFRFFQIRKSSLVIAILVFLVLTLTLFCIKQQNDYALLNNEYYKQSISVKEIQTEEK
ncbi:MAG: hypothetical protein LIO93_04530 [Bacteroidales bacterium]|nr:hypothetical protein [Bacteroidales bacterium]